MASKPRRIKVVTVFQELYAVRYSKPQYLKSGYAYEVRMNWQNHLAPLFGSRLISRITVPQIHAWHEKYVNWPYAGNRSKSILSAIFSFAELKGYMPPGSNPVTSVPNHREYERARFASSSELKKLDEILTRDLETRRVEATFIYLLLLTGARPRAVERFTWNNLVRNEDGTGHFEVLGKTGERDIIAISAEAMRLIDRLPRGEDSSPLLGSFPRYYWEQIRKAAGCDTLWARDLRRTFGTMALSCGITLGAVGELLNHRKLQTTMRYSKLMGDARMNAVAQISQELQRVVR
jgi:integrase